MHAAEQISNSERPSAVAAKHPHATGRPATGGCTAGREGGPGRPALRGNRKGGYVGSSILADMGQSPRDPARLVRGSFPSSRSLGDWGERGQGLGLQPP
ncbi:hypothetical protein VTK73DRAFT_4345 [Phialemonium thermophilum]|uniref:Uncharacterized protein n=1 Tax=Phialemonium thermophilum TaxID=223376 RepID=A0ABR3V9H8_9PEZI